MTTGLWGQQSASGGRAVLARYVALSGIRCRENDKGAFQGSDRRSCARAFEKAYPRIHHSLRIQLGDGLRRELVVTQEAPRLLVTIIV